MPIAIGPSSKLSPPVVIPAPDFDLALTLRSGQLFRYRPLNDGFEIFTHGRRIVACQNGDRLEIAGADAAFARGFFGLEEDLASARRALAGEPLVGDALARYRGLRLLRQDP